MILLLALTLLSATPDILPDTLRIETCYGEAEIQYPRHQELALQEKITQLKLENLKARFFPSLHLNGQATYQSEVPDFPIQLPGASIPEISKDQYKLALNINQLVYDGGLIDQQKTLETIRRDVAQKEVEVELYQLRNQINVTYFGVLLHQARIVSLSTLRDDIRSKLDIVRSGVRHGVRTAGDADVLAVELIKTEQQIAEAEASRLTALSLLGELLGRPLPDDAILIMPDVTIEDESPVIRDRPEYELFTLSKSSLAEQQVLSSLTNRPIVSSFAEAAYGRPPGMNFFDNDFKPFYSLGLRVQWPFWDWHTSRRDREMLSLQQQVVESQEETFTQQLTVSATREWRDIRRIEELLQRDEEIIILRQRISQQAASRLENGVITSTDYLIERNAEHQAHLIRTLHQLQLAQARVQYLTTIGPEK